MKYEFRNANGHSCCKSNHIELLCDQCKPKALAVLTRELAGAPHAATAPLPKVARTVPTVATAPAPTPTVARDFYDVPPAPSLGDAIRALWAKATPAKKAAATQSETRVNANGVPNAPDLRSAVLAQEGR